MQDWHFRLQTSSRAIFYNTIASFQYQRYLDSINDKMKKSNRMSFRQIEIILHID